MGEKHVEESDGVLQKESEISRKDLKSLEIPEKHTASAKIVDSKHSIKPESKEGAIGLRSILNKGSNERTKSVDESKPVEKEKDNNEKETDNKEHKSSSPEIKDSMYESKEPTKNKIDDSKHSIKPESNEGAFGLRNILNEESNVGTNPVDESESKLKKVADISRKDLKSVEIPLKDPEKHTASAKIEDSKQSIKPESKDGAIGLRSILNKGSNERTKSVDESKTVEKEKHNNEKENDNKEHKSYPPEIKDSMQESKEPTKNKDFEDNEEISKKSKSNEKIIVSKDGAVGLKNILEKVNNNQGN